MTELNDQAQALLAKHEALVAPVLQHSQALPVPHDALICPVLNHTPYVASCKPCSPSSTVGTSTRPHIQTQIFPFSYPGTGLLHQALVFTIEDKLSCSVLHPVTDLPCPASRTDLLRPESHTDLLRHANHAPSHPQWAPCPTPGHRSSMSPIPGTDSVHQALGFSSIS